MFPAESVAIDCTPLPPLSPKRAARPRTGFPGDAAISGRVNKRKMHVQDIIVRTRHFSLTIGTCVQTSGSSFLAHWCLACCLARHAVDCIYGRRRIDRGL